MTYRTGFALIIVAALAASACSTGVADESIPTTSTTILGRTGESTPTAPEGDEAIVNEPIPTTPPLSTSRAYEGESYPGELSGLVGGAVADLSAYLGVDVATISIAQVEEVVWPNGGLGCPKPGMAYAQVLTDGLRIVLVHDGTEYFYHSGGAVEPFLCTPWPHESPKGSGSDLRGPIGEYETPGEGTIELVESKPPTDSLPTEEAGGPGGQPDE